MTTTNVSDEKQQFEKAQYLYCSLVRATTIHGQLTFIAVLNVFLSITAFLGNVLVLVALRKDSSLHPPSKLLFRSLAVTDLFAGLCSEPLYVTLLMTVVNEHWNICRYVAVAFSIIGTILASASLLTLTAISVDRLLALMLGLRYRHAVTLKRTRLIIITFWVLSASLATMRFFYNLSITSRYEAIVILLCLVTSTFSHTKIFLSLRHHQSQVRDHNVQQPNQTNQLNIARFRKAVSTALWLQFSLIVCYLPVISTNLFMKTESSLSVILAGSYTITLLFLNSSLNPILYCWKIDEVRQAMKEMLRQMLCC